MKDIILYKDNDQKLVIKGNDKLKDQKGDAIVGADVKATMYEYDGTTEVSGITWPLNLTDLGSGEYEASLPHTIGVEAGNHYFLKVVATYDGILSTVNRRVLVKNRY